MEQFTHTDLPQFRSNNGENGTRSMDSDPEHSGDELSSRESSAEQDISDTSDKLLDDSKSIKKPFSEDFVNNNKENDYLSRSWVMNPLRRSGPLEGRRGSEEEASGRDSEEKMSESEEEKSSPRSEERDLNMNTGLFGSKIPGLDKDNPLSEQLKSVTEKISQLVSEAGTADNPKTLQDLAVLQTTLFTLQQQQILQMQILAHMQSQMKTSDGAYSPKVGSDPDTSNPLFKLQELEKGDLGTGSLRKLQDFIGSENQPAKSEFGRSISSDPASAPSGLPTPPSTAPSQHYPGSALPPGDEGPATNSLELLQQKAQGILNNASHGLLKHSLADLSYSKNVSKDDPHFKHRCKFCGKVFGSDSALQIHIRLGWKTIHDLSRLSVLL